MQSENEVKALLDLLKRNEKYIEKLLANMVVYMVENYLDSVFMCTGDKCFVVVVASVAWVYPVIIGGLITVITVVRVIFQDRV